ncbi:MAG: DUF421 domain-containing protein [Oscillospiraceae bacterium]|nr:DUF421 domain-containing protein [Oscillospiraceae bacterium]
MLISLIRTLLLYTAILFAVRLMGKRQLSELQTSELVVTLLISDIAAIPMQDTSQPLLSGFLPIGILVGCELVVSVLMMKSVLFRKWVCGSPIIVIRDGKVDRRQLRRLRMTVEDLFSQLRQSGVGHLEEVSYAIMETNGTLSVLKKPGCDTPTCEMLELKTMDQDMEVVVISDGVVSETGLSLCGKSRPWLEGVLQGEHLRCGDIFIMLLNTNGSYQIIKKEDV